MKFIVLILTFLLLVFFAFSDNINSSLAFNHITKAEGLSDDLIFSIFQDSIGYIWVGTSSGLNRYDGYKFKKFRHNPEDPESLPHSVVTWICEDKDKNLWIATYGGGISKFDRKNNSFSNHPSFGNSNDIQSSKIVNHINSDSKGTLWIASKGGGLTRFNPVSQQVKKYGPQTGRPGSLSADAIMSTFEDSSGNIWAATWGDGLSRYSKGNDSFEKISPPEKKNNPICSQYIHTIIEGPEKNLWLGTKENGLIRYSRKTGSFRCFGTEKKRKVNLIKKRINIIFHDPENDSHIWIGTENGLYVYKIFENKFIAYNRKSENSGLSHNYIWSIIRDRSGLLWVGTVGGGINLEKRGSEFFNRIHTSESTEHSLSSNKISAIYSNRNDPETLWIGTLGGGLNKRDLRSGKTKRYLSGDRRNNSISENNITSIISEYANPDILYIGTNSGLNKYNKKTDMFTKLESPLSKYSNFNSTFVSALMSSEIYEGFLWVGTFGGGLYRIDLNNYNLTNYRFQKDDRHTTEMNRVYTIKQSKSDQRILWLGTNTGFGKFIIKSGDLKFYEPGESPILSTGTHVLSIHESEINPGIIWGGTRGRGFFRFDSNNESFTLFTIKEGLPDNTIVSIVEEPPGNLWLGTLKGLSLYNIKTGKYRNFDKCEGLLNSEFHLNASHVSTDRGIFIGGPNGIDSFSPDKLNTNMNIPSIVLTELKIFGSSELPGMDEILQHDISETDEIILPGNYNTITISFASLDFTSPEKNQFSCMMRGVDSDWKNLGAKNHVSYEKLEPGKYTFTVKGSNSDSVWNENGRELRIIINSHFTGSLWFWIILTGIIIALITFSHFLYRIIKKHPVPSGTTVENLLQDDIITEREKEIIILILKGKSNREIEDELFISLGTVKNHLYNIYKKLKVKSRTQLITLLRLEERNDNNN